MGRGNLKATETVSSSPHIPVISWGTLAAHFRAISNLSVQGICSPYIYGIIKRVEGQIPYVLAAAVNIKPQPFKCGLYCMCFPQ